MNIDDLEKIDIGSAPEEVIQQCISIARAIRATGRFMFLVGGAMTVVLLAYAISMLRVENPWGILLLIVGTYCGYRANRGLRIQSLATEMIDTLVRVRQGE